LSGIALRYHLVVKGIRPGNADELTQGAAAQSLFTLMTQTSSDVQTKAH
ncbi:MAG: hypothetical protein HC848_08785, partial [Limnobacter sp.]|nr:hypothetical protein [Limnobacter sp.]